MAKSARESAHLAGRMLIVSVPDGNQIPDILARRWLKPNKSGKRGIHEGKRRTTKGHEEPLKDTNPNSPWLSWHCDYGQIAWWVAVP